MTGGTGAPPLPAVADEKCFTIGYRVSTLTWQSSGRTYLAVGGATVLPLSQMVRLQEVLMFRQIFSAPLRRSAGALALLVAVGACGSNSLAPFQPEVSNVADNFSLQATGVTGVTTTINYNWSNSGTVARINHATSTTGGATLLTIKDANGTTVYSKALVPSLNELTSPAGVAGTWTIQLTLTDYSGTLNFSAQKG